MKHFLYVFSARERDALLSAGYTLLQSNEQNDVFVFENTDKLTFSQSDVKAVPSDVLRI